MTVQLLGWIAIPLGLIGMAVATKYRWGFALMMVANLLWVAIGICNQCHCMTASSGIYSILTLRNAMIFGR